MNAPMPSLIPSRKGRMIVDLPNMKPSIELPKGCGTVLKHIIAFRAKGINTLQLQELGICATHNKISTLREQGADIRTTRKPAIDAHGNRHKCIAHYYYHGWRI